VPEWPSDRRPGEKVAPGPVKVTVVLTTREVENLELQARADGVSVTDCIRRSIALGQIAWEAQRKPGSRLLLETPGGELRPIELLPPGRS